MYTYDQIVMDQTESINMGEVTSMHVIVVKKSKIYVSNMF